MVPEYRVGCYYFPNYHGDDRNAQVHGKGWNEWELVRKARPRITGHSMPKVPLWGYLDESDPHVMETKITAAADHGIDHFIFDWYWYDDGPFLQHCLDNGFLGASNNDRLQFCCMWANHDWYDIHPERAGVPPKLLYRGAVAPATFERITDHVVTTYFQHPSYFSINNRPYFSVYELSKLVDSFGGMRSARNALERFRDKARRAGFVDIHLNAVVWGHPVLPHESVPADPCAVAEGLGFDSITSYVWIHHTILGTKPTTPYAAVREDYFSFWDKTSVDAALPYYPNVTMGWDPSPRTSMDDAWAPGSYPYTSIVTGNSPAAFKESLRRTKNKLDRGTEPKILNINCWNEWTEGSYLEPDSVNGMAYLQAVRDTFGK